MGDTTGSFQSWTNAPHWIAVTYSRAPPGSGPDGRMQQREDFKSTCCAVQNFLLSMWSEGVGTKWTRMNGPIQRTDEFAQICNINLEKVRSLGKCMCRVFARNFHFSIPGEGRRRDLVRICQRRTEQSRGKVEKKGCGGSPGCVALI